MLCRKTIASTGTTTESFQIKLLKNVTVQSTLSHISTLWFKVYLSSTSQEWQWM